MFSSNSSNQCFQYFFELRGKFGSSYLGKAQQPQEQRCLFLSACVVFSCVQTMVWLPVFGIFNLRTGVDECSCTQGRDKNASPYQGLKPASALCLAFPLNVLPAELSLPHCTLISMCFIYLWLCDYCDLRQHHNGMLVGD